MKESVYVGMSGGVDSSVAAFLLKEQGYEVTGFTMEVWGNGGAAAEAKKVCESLGIPHVTVDLKALFKQQVVSPFLAEYARARTPNPCVLCNRKIKFGAMLEYIRGKADYIATGHYARVVLDQSSGRWHFEKSADQQKDQTYMFYTLRQDQISKIKMPLGGYTKPEVRKIALGQGFSSAQAPDSQDICFLEGQDLKGFLRENAPQQLREGDILSEDGSLLGKHRGISCYTLGQRRGLGVPADRKLYVTGLDAENNTVILGGEQSLFRDTLYAEDVNFQPFARLEAPLQVTAKIRYAAKPAEAVITPAKSGVQVKFTQPQRAITPGQSVVFYDGGVLLGGGTIL